MIHNHNLQILKRRHSLNADTNDGVLPHKSCFVLLMFFFFLIHRLKNSMEMNRTLNLSLAFALAAMQPNERHSVWFSCSGALSLALHCTSHCCVLLWSYSCNANPVCCALLSTCWHPALLVVVAAIWHSCAVHFDGGGWTPENLCLTPSLQVFTAALHQHW